MRANKEKLHPDWAVLGLARLERAALVSDDPGYHPEWPMMFIRRWESADAEHTLFFTVVREGSRGCGGCFRSSQRRL